MAKEGVKLLRNAVTLVEAERCEQEVLEERVTVFRLEASLAHATGGDTGRDEESQTRMKRTSSRLLASGLTRPLRRPPQNWQMRIDSLAQQFPNFASLIKTVVRPHIGLTSRGIEHRLPPILLAGPPGVGKTFFANALAGVLGVGLPLFISMASESNGSSLAGSSTFWANSSPGRLFELLAWGRSFELPIANPLILLDEIDKVQFRNVQHDPLGALYTLLEVETARHFTDQSLHDVGIDTSFCRIIATANDLSGVPEPIRSRTLVFEVAEPSQHQLTEIIRGMYLDLALKFNFDSTAKLPPRLIDAALTMSPREVKVRLECAVASAYVDGRNSVNFSDWPAIAASVPTVRRQPIGFTA